MEFETSAYGPSGRSNKRSAAQGYNVTPSEDSLGSLCTMPVNETDSSRLQSNNGKKKCCECGASDTPQWRQGPAGPQTLCNACGVRHSRLLRRLRGGKKKRTAAGAAPANASGDYSGSLQQTSEEEEEPAQAEVCTQTLAQATLLAPELCPEDPALLQTLNPDKLTLHVSSAADNNSNADNNNDGDSDTNSRGGDSATVGFFPLPGRHYNLADNNCNSPVKSAFAPEALAAAPPAKGPTTPTRGPEAGGRSPFSRASKRLRLESTSFNYGPFSDDDNGRECEAALNLLSIAAGLPPGSSEVLGPGAFVDFCGGAARGLPRSVSATVNNLATLQLLGANMRGGLVMTKEEEPQQQPCLGLAPGMAPELPMLQALSQPAEADLDLDIIIAIVRGDVLQHLLPMLGPQQLAHLKSLCEMFDSSYKALVSAHAARDAVAKVLAAKQEEAKRVGETARRTAQTLLQEAQRLVHSSCASKQQQQQQQQQQTSGSSSGSSSMETALMTGPAAMVHAGLLVMP